MDEDNVMTMDEIERRMKRMEDPTLSLPQGDGAETSPSFSDVGEGQTVDGSSGGEAAAERHTGKEEAGTAAMQRYTGRVDGDEAATGSQHTRPEVTGVEAAAEPRPAEKGEAGVGGYSEIWRLLEPYKMPTGEELKKERRRERREMAIRALGDGLSALAGMAGAMAGGRNTVRHELSLTKAGTELREKLRKEREARRDLYVKNAISTARLDAESHRTRAMAEKAEQQADLNRYRAENSLNVAMRKLDLAESKQDFEREKSEALIELQRQRDEVNAQYKAGMLSVAQMNAETSRLNAQSRALMAKKYHGGRGGGRSGSGSEKESATDWMYRIQDEDPEGYADAVEGALGYHISHPTSAQAGRIRSYYKNKKKIKKPAGGGNGAAAMQQQTGRDGMKGGGGSSSGKGVSSSGGGRGNFENVKKLGL